MEPQPMEWVGAVNPRMGCEQCGATIRAGEDFAEVFDPSAPDLPSQIVHADTCVPPGWEVA